MARVVLFLTAAAALAMSAPAGCGPERPAGPAGVAGDMTAGPAEARRLAADLDAFLEAYESLVAGAAEAAGRLQTGRNARQAALLWKTRGISRMQDKIHQADPPVALLDAWIECTRTLLYLRDGDGAKLFGDRQGPAVAAAQQAVDLIERVAQQFVKRDRLESVRADVARYARERPLVGLFDESRPATVRADNKALDGLLGALTLPLAPFTVPGQIEKATTSFRDIDTTANRFVDTVGDLPQEVRWQAELLLLSAGEDESVKSALGSFDRLSRSSEAISKTAAGLPEETRKQGEALLASVDKNTTVKSVVEGANHVSTAAEELSRTAAALPQDTRKEAEALLAALDKNATTQSALASLERISKATEEANKTAAALPDSMGRTLDRSSEAAAAQARDLIDHIAWRGLQLLAAAFGFAAGLILLSRWRRAAVK